MFIGTLLYVFEIIFRFNNSEIVQNINPERTDLD